MVLATRVAFLAIIALYWKFISLTKIESCQTGLDITAELQPLRSCDGSPET